MKLLKITTFISIIFFTFNNSCFSQETKELMPIMPRIGIKGILEINKPQLSDEKKTVKKETPKKEKKTDVNDLDIQKIAKEIKDEIDDEKDDNLADLRILWQSAIERSETIKFAILKLSNPDGDKVKTSAVKKILSPLANVAPLIGMGTPNVAAGTGAMFGGSLLNSILADDSFINNKLSRVTDSDLVLLSQEIDSLQQKLVTLYKNYTDSRERLDFTNKILENRYKYYQASQNSAPENLAVADVFYREAQDIQYKSKLEAEKARAELEQLAGSEARVIVDDNLKKRSQEGTEKF